MIFSKKLIFTFIVILFLNKCLAQEIDTLINIGNYQLHFNITKGIGVPIFFEAGAGNDGSIWDTIIKPLYDSLGTTLIRYDRQGFGKSGIDTNNLSIIDEIKGFEAAMSKMGFGKKLFFVAHSLGGNYAMVFNNRNKGKVIGGVLIDNPSPCFMTDKKAAEVKALYWDSREEIKKESLGFYYIVKNYMATSKAMRDAARFMTLPLTIICSDSTPFENKERIIWKNCLKNFANEAPNRRFLMADNCGHYVFFDNPTFVINAIIRQYRSLIKKGA